MQTPGVTPYIEHPVSTEEFLDAAIQLDNNEPISNDKIKAFPEGLQQVLTIGLIQKIVSKSFVKIGELLEEIDYQIMTAASAFQSHSRGKLKNAFAKRYNVTI